MRSGSHRPRHPSLETYSSSKGPYQNYVDMGEGGGVWQMSTKGSVKRNTVEKNVHEGEGEGEGSEMCEIMST